MALNRVTRPACPRRGPTTMLQAAPVPAPSSVWHRRAPVPARSVDDGLVDVEMEPEMAPGLGRSSGLCSTLYSGCVYRGTQVSDDRNYQVVVEFKTVDLDKSVVCGDITIKGLTDQYPELTTFFDAEIIGPDHTFLTQKWDATEQIDFAHWLRLNGFQDAGVDDKKFLNRHFVFDHRASDYVFMRWKEHFLVPDHTVDKVKGASFAGFYYICFCRSKGTIEGLYYHSDNVEWYQELKLRLCEERQFPCGFDFC